MYVSGLERDLGICILTQHPLVLLMRAAHYPTLKNTVMLVNGVASAKWVGVGLTVQFHSSRNGPLIFLSAVSNESIRVFPHLNITYPSLQLTFYIKIKLQKMQRSLTASFVVGINLTLFSLNFSLLKGED